MVSHGNNFPKVCAKLENKKINYLVLNKKTGYDVEETFDNKEKNKYDDIFLKAHNYVKIKMRIEKINKELMKNIEKPEIKKKILQIEEIVYDRGKI